MENPCGIKGIAFVEWAPGGALDAAGLGELFAAFGFSRTHQHRSAAVEVFRQHDIRFLVNAQPRGFAADFGAAHGASVCGLGLWVEDPQAAFQAAVARGARPWAGPGVPYDVPAILGVGDSLVYFVTPERFWGELAAHPAPLVVPDAGFLAVDHLTNNVYQGTLARWSSFYQDVLGFTEVRTFDIRGERTGLYSHALRSPCGSFCIPINEGTEEKSQIEEYLRDYRGPGVQHIAFLTDDLIGSLDRMRGGPVRFLDIDAAYYRTVFERVPGVREDPARLEALQILVDGDEAGYLLQIFTQNLVGPIFIELIQRRNHLSFGEGNFGALFRSIERDQERRGVL
ncbi:MAG: 4-hydroxyphenylpyruvate dioxygenase [Myxococcales bacterium]|nr:4-hydroxyphenylpyruvate dioxygenase [Myxococcales bacterium]MCB9544647.1 4-hydroxyphenylpyruvate dioxygenase [Myxococcales bacterium]